MAFLWSFGAACGRWRPQLLLVAIGVLALSVAGAGVRLAQQWRDETYVPTSAELLALRARLYVASANGDGSASAAGTGGAAAAFASSGAESSWRARLAALRTLGVPSHWDADNQVHAALIDGLLRRARDNTLIVMYGSGALEELLLNAVCHWARLRMNNYIIFSSGEALQALRAHPLLAGAPTEAVVDVVTVLGGPASGLAGVDLGAYHNFDTTGFSVQTRIKFLLAELMVQLGLHVIVQDADVIPLRDFRPHILSRACRAVDEALRRQPPSEAGAAATLVAPRNGPAPLPPAETVTTCGTADYTPAAERGELFALDTAPFIFTSLEMRDDADFPNKAACNCNHNTGFFFLRSSYFSVFAMRHVVRMLEHDKAASTDQRIFGEFLRGWGSLLDERVAPLSYDLFPSGLAWVPGKEEDQALAIHANWVFGLKEKRAKLFRAGLMLWDAQTKMCLR